MRAAPGEHHAVLVASRLAVVIGIDRYRDGVPALRNAVRDARAVSAALDAHGFRASDGNLIELLDEAADHASLTDLFARQLPARVGDEDDLLVYFAGHGQAVADERGVLRGYLLPVDAERQRRARFLDMEVVREALARLPCRHLFVMLDCCSAGMFARLAHRDVDDERPPVTRARYDAWRRRRAFQLLASASYDELAVDSFEAKVAQDGGGDHSPFARAVVDALTKPNEVDLDRDGMICATEIYLHTRRVLQGIPGARDQTPNYWPLEWHDGGEWTFLFGDPRFFVPGGLSVDDSPYRGLSPFRTEDQRLFFGRRAVAEQLAVRVRAARLTIVVGPSGVGKTSLLAAGVVPLVKSDCGVYGPSRPGADPLSVFAHALAELEDAGGPSPQVWIVDPLEELVTMTVSASVRAAALNVLRAAAGEPIDPACRTALGADDVAHFDRCLESIAAIGERLHLVLSVRNDHAPVFHDRLVPAERWTACQVTVPAMNRDELRECIERPANDRFLIFSADFGSNGKRIVETLLDEVEQVPGALPLLSVALDEMFRAYVESRRDDCTIGWDEYRAIGGVDGALQRRAEALYAFARGPAAASDERERAARRGSLRDLILRMVSFEAGAIARRRVRRADLVFDDAAESDRTNAVLDALIADRLVIASDDHVEPAHDVLLRSWPRALEWIDASRLALRDRVTAAAEQWKAATGRSQRLALWDDDRLAALQALEPERRYSIRALLAKLPPSTFTRTEHAFVIASDRARRRKRWSLAMIVSAIGAALAAAAIFSQVQRAEAERQRAAGHDLLMRSYLDRAQREMLDGRPLAALPLLVAAREGGLDTPSLRAIFAWASAALPQRVFDQTARDGLYVGWLDDDRVLAGSHDGVSIWDIGAGTPIATIAPAAGIGAFAMTRDGTTIATADERFTPGEGHVAVWSTRSPQHPLASVPFAGEVSAIALSGDGRRVAVAGDAVLVWNVSGPELIARARLGDGGGNWADLSGDGKRLLVATGRTVKVLDLEGGKPSPPIETPAPSDWKLLMWSTLSPDGSWVATAASGRGQVFDARTAKPHTPVLERGPFHDGDMSVTVQISSDSQLVLTADNEASSVGVWTIDGEHLTTFREAGLVDAELARRADRVLVSSQRGLSLWDAVTGARLSPTVEWTFDNDMATEPSPDGTRVALATSAGATWVWDLRRWLPEDHDVQRSPPEYVDTINALDVCDARTVIARTERGEVMRWENGVRVRGAAACDRDVWTETTPRGIVVHRRGGVAVLLDDSIHAESGALSDDGDRFVAAITGGTGIVRWWNARTGRADPARARLGRVDALGWRGRDVLALSGAMMQVFDERGQLRWSSPLPGVVPGLSSEISRRGDLLVTAGSEADVVRVWDLQTATLLMATPGSGAALSADGSTLVVMAEDHVQVFDPRSGQTITPSLPIRGKALELSISPHGDMIAASTEHGGFSTWHLHRDTRSLMEWNELVAACDPYVLVGGVLERHGFDAAACQRVVNRR